MQYCLSTITNQEESCYLQQAETLLFLWVEIKSFSESVLLKTKWKDQSNEKRDGENRSVV